MEITSAQLEWSLSAELSHHRFKTPFQGMYIHVLDLYSRQVLSWYFKKVKQREKEKKEKGKKEKENALHASLETVKCTRVYTKYIPSGYTSTLQPLNL